MPTSHPDTLDFNNIALQHDAGDAFAALPAHVLITHVLSSGNLPAPSDLARLRALSHAMRDAVDVTGRQVYEMGAKKAIEFGDFIALQLIVQRGDLDDDSDSLCMWAAEKGQLEILKWLRENDFRWDEVTCAEAAYGGHLEVLHWLRLPTGRGYVLEGGAGRAPRGATVVADKRLPVERVDVLDRGGIRAPRNTTVGSLEQLPVGRVYVRVRGAGRPPRGASVVARERLPVEPANAHRSEIEQASRVV